MAVDYLKTYLGIDPNDYSSMEARIRGEEPQARTPVMMRQPMMMPQQRSLGDIEAMQLIPRQQPAPQVDDRYQGLTDQIVALKSQIEGMQAPQPAPQVDERYQGLMDQIAALRSQIEGMQAPTEQAPVGAEAPVMAEQAPVMADEPVSPSLPEGIDAGGRFYTGPNGENMYQPPMPKIGPGQLQAQVMPTPINLDTGMQLDTRLPSLSDRLKTEPYQAPVGIENRAVGEPEPIPQAPAEDIQASINYLASLPKMNIPQIPDIEQIKQKMAEANMNFPEPVSYQDQLQSIRDLPPMTQMPTREEIQMAMQNIPVPEKAFKPAQTIQEKIQAVMQNMPVPEKAFTPAQTIQEKIQMAMQNMPVPEKAFTPAQTIQEKIQMAMQNMPTPIPEPMVFPSIPKFSSPVPQMPTREEIQAAMQNIPTPTAPVSSMPKFNLPQMQSFGLPQQIAGGRTLMSDFSPRNVMRMANGGGIDQAIYDLKFKLNG
jgi:hypothetical protein